MLDICKPQKQRKKNAFHIPTTLKFPSTFIYSSIDMRLSCHCETDYTNENEKVFNQEHRP